MSSNQLRQLFMRYAEAAKALYKVRISGSNHGVFPLQSLTPPPVSTSTPFVSNTCACLTRAPTPSHQRSPFLHARSRQCTSHFRL
jgi:hypothetical protein